MERSFPPIACLYWILRRALVMGSYEQIKPGHIIQCLSDQISCLHHNCTCSHIAVVVSINIYLLLYTYIYMYMYVYMQSEYSH